MILFRHNDRRFPFLWESPLQPPARWHAEGDGPAQYLADTPGGAWAEFLRHEEITDPEDLAGISRAMWAVEVGQPEFVQPELSEAMATGGADTYDLCQDEASRLRAAGTQAIRVKAAALIDGGATPFRVDHGLQDGDAADGHTLVFFGPQPNFVGWLIVDEGRPPAAILEQVRHFE